MPKPWDIYKGSEDQPRDERGRYAETDGGVGADDSEHFSVNPSPEVRAQREAVANSLRRGDKIRFGASLSNGQVSALNGKVSYVEGERYGIRFAPGKPLYIADREQFVNWGVRKL